MIGGVRSRIIRNWRKFTHEHQRGLATLVLAAGFDLAFAIEKFLQYFEVKVSPLTLGILYAALAVAIFVLALWDYLYDVKADCRDVRGGEALSPDAEASPCVEGEKSF